jgi:hypothetical protein
VRRDGRADRLGKNQLRAPARIAGEHRFDPGDFARQLGVNAVESGQLRGGIFNGLRGFGTRLRELTLSDFEAYL